MSSPQSLLNKSLRAAGWGYAGSVIRLVIQVFAQVVLARLLGPQEYGLFAIGVILVALTFLFSDVASSALIQIKEVGVRQIQFAFFCQVTAGLSATVILMVCAQPISNLINQPESYAIICAVAPICFINAMGGVALAQLRRDLRYGVIQIAQTLGYFVGYVVVGIPLALFTSAGVWSLVAAWLVQAILTNTVCWLSAPHSLRFALSCEHSTAMIRFGKSAMLANFSNWALSNIDRLIVARFSPLVETGNYTTSINLLSTPLAQILTTFQSVAFSASSRLEAQDGRKVFLPLVGLLSLVTWCMYGFCYATSDILIAALYGDKWLGAAPYVKAFSVSLAAYGTMSAVTPLLWAKGNVDREAIPQFFMALVLGVAVWVAIKHSPLAAAWAVAGVSVLRCIWIVVNGVRVFDISVRKLLGMLSRVGLFVIFQIGICGAVSNYAMQYYSSPYILVSVGFCGWLLVLGLAIPLRHIVFDEQLASLLDKPINAITKRVLQ